MVTSTQFRTCGDQGRIVKDKNLKQIGRITQSSGGQNPAAPKILQVSGLSDSINTEILKK